MVQGVNPVFLKSRDIPTLESGEPAITEVCAAAERVAGPGSIDGAQNISGLWRIYPMTKEARNTLLIQGLYCGIVRA